MPQKAAVENNRVRHNRLGIAKMMAGDRLQGRMLQNKISETRIIQDRRIAGSMHRREAILKFTFQNGRDGAAAILEYVVVNDQESRRRNRQPDIHAHS